MGGPEVGDVGPQGITKGQGTVQCEPGWWELRYGAHLPAVGEG